MAGERAAGVTLRLKGALGLFAAILAAATLAGCGGAIPAPSASPSTPQSASPSPIATPSPSPTLTFTWESRVATAADLGTSWREGCPVGPESLIVVEVTHWTFDGTVETGELVINGDIETRARAAFSTLFDQRFPIRSMINVDAFSSDDDASMAADNTSAFNCRRIAGTDDWSNHAYGRAIDINPVENPYILNGDVQPPAAVAYIDRVDGPGLLIEGDAALNAFTDQGFGWGGAWPNPDYQHVEIAP